MNRGPSHEVFSDLEGLKAPSPEDGRHAARGEKRGVLRPVSRALAALACVLFLACPALVRAEPGAVVTGSLDQVEKYGPFEATIDVSTVASNLQFPYDPDPPAGVAPGVGVTVDALFLPPGESAWENARVQPCFWYQPMTESRGDFYPDGSPHFRARFAPDLEGEWRYKIRVTDAEGTGESAEGSFICTGANSRGFVRTSPSDPRFFEFDDGTTFTHPSIEKGGWGDIATQDTLLPTLTTNGVRYVRWYLTPRGGIQVFGGTTNGKWDGRTVVGENGQGQPGFALAPVTWTRGEFFGLPVGTQVRLSCRAKLTGRRPLAIRIQEGDAVRDSVLVSPPTDGWQTVGLDTYTVRSEDPIRCFFVAPDNSGDEDILIDDIRVEISTDGGNTWLNAATRGRADTYTYMDDREAYRIDRFFKLCDAQGMYNKMTVLDKDDFVLSRMGPDHTFQDERDDNNTYAPWNDGDNPSRWYQQAWWRYFIARWSAYQSVHTLEYANENDPFSGVANEAAYAMAEYFHANSPRYLLMGNSTWHSFVRSFWADDRMDYADIHGYTGPGTPESGSEGTRYFWGLTGEDPDGNSLYHPWSVDNPNGAGRVFAAALAPDAPDRTRDIRVITYIGGEPGRRYRVRAQVRTHNLTTNPANSFERPALRLAAYQGYTAENDAQSAVQNTNLPLGTYEWREIVSEPWAMPLGKDILSVQLDMWGPGGTLWMDDVAVEEEVAQDQWRRIYLHTWDENRVDFDSALDVRAFWTRLSAFRLPKPIVRSESGLRGWNIHGSPFIWNGQSYLYRDEEQDLVRDADGIYYQKKLWAQLGCPGFYSGQLWTDNLAQKNLWFLYGAYANFLEGERISNGNYDAVGSDLDGDQALTAGGGLRCWGIRDRAASKALLWIDNPDHTWRDVVDEAPIPAKSGQVAVPDFAPGSYTLEWWDTRAGSVTRRQPVSVGGNGILRIDVNNLATDVAVKVIRN